MRADSSPLASWAPVTLKDSSKRLKDLGKLNVDSEGRCLNSQTRLSDDSKKISQLTSLPTLQAQTHAACSTPSACAPSPIGFAIALAAPLNAEDKADPLNITPLDSTAGDINDDVSESTVGEHSDSVVGVLGESKEQAKQFRLEQYPS
ncbi:hypothetical protein C8J56DRAFT_1058978 [Mycena floridula]|nr:hypothetical protein C8J56DRAFT_1058978 [Mycena floridula]